MADATSEKPLDRIQPRPLWRNLSFSLMWSSVAASGFGDRMMVLAAIALLGGAHAQAAGSSIQAGVMFFFLLPYVFVCPLGGWLADTLPRKWVMLACDESRALLMLLSVLLIPAALAGPVPVEHHWKIYGVMLGMGFFAAIFSPTRNATVPQIVPLRQLQSANAIIIGIATIASLIGVYIGGQIINPDNPGTIRNALYVGVGLFVISGSFFAFLKLRISPSQPIGPRPSEWQRMHEAISYVRQHRRIVEVMIVTVLFWGAANLMIAALFAIAKLRFGENAAGQYDANLAFTNFTFMSAVLGLGMLVGALLLSVFSHRRESAWFGLISLMLAGVSMIAVALSTHLTLSLVLSGVAGMFGSMCLVTATSLTQNLSADYIRGRVFGLRDMANTASAVIVNLIIWRIPDADTKMIPALIVVSCGLIAFAVYGLVRDLTSGPMPTKTLNLLWRVFRAFLMGWHRLRWLNAHHIPGQGPVILAANHTSGTDPFIMQAPCPRLIRWVMTRTYHYGWLNFVWKRINPIVLDNTGRDSRQLRQLIEALDNDDIIGIFPEGRLQRGHRELGKFEPGIALLAKRTEAVIVPIWIAGTPQSRSMLWHFLRPSRSVIIFGKPYRPDPEQSAQEILDDLRQRMLDLAAQVDDAPTTSDD